MRPKGSAAQLEYRRQLGGKLLAQGKGVRALARLLGGAPSSVWRWKQALKGGGLPALQANPHRGRRPRLSPKQKARLEQALAKGPRAQGYPTALWTCPRSAALIEHRFGVRYHPAHIWRVVRRLVWTCQPPEHRACERDEEAIQRWRTRTWPWLKKSAAAGRHSGLAG